jgi:hypothetical protein
MSAFIHSLSDIIHESGAPGTSSESPGISQLFRSYSRFVGKLKELGKTFDYLVGEGDPEGRHSSVPKDASLLALLRSDKFPKDLATLVGLFANAKDIEASLRNRLFVEHLEEVVDRLTSDIAVASEQGSLPPSRQVFARALDAVASALESKGLRILAAQVDAVTNAISTSHSASSIEVCEAIEPRAPGRIIKLPAPPVDPMDAGRFSDADGATHDESGVPVPDSRPGSPPKTRQVQDGFTDQGFRPSPGLKPKRRDLTNETDSREWRRGYQKEYRENNP